MSFIFEISGDFQIDNTPGILAITPMALLGQFGLVVVVLLTILRNMETKIT